MQNINIVYKVDKSEIDRSNAAVQQAKGLTDQLKKSTQDYGQSGVKANQQFSGSIEAVKVKMAQLQKQIELTNRSDTKRMNDLIKQYNQAKSEVDKFNQSLKQSAQATSQQTQGVNNAAGAFMNLYSAIKLVIGAQVIREFVNTTLEAATLAGQVEAVGNAFRKQIPNAESVLFKLKNATRGTVSELELMQRALKFQNYGANVEALPAILEFAAVRAQQTGVSIDYMVNSIIDGIGRKSIRVLDNLQISASAIKDEMHGISMESATVAQVSEAMGRVASRELEKMGEFAENSATAVDKLKVAIDDLRKEAAKKFEAGGVVQFFNDIVDGSKLAVKNLSPDPLTTALNIRKDVQAQFEYKEALEAVEAVKKQANGTTQEQIDFIQQEINSRVQLVAKRNDEIKAAQEALAEVRKNEPYSDRIDILNQMIGSMAANRYELQQMIPLLVAYRKSLEDANTADVAELTTLKTKRNELAALKQQREEETSFYNQEELDGLQRQINLLDDLILKVDDRIAWEKKWTAQSAINTAEQWRLNEALEEQAKALEKLSKQFRVEDIGKGTITENIDLSGYQSEYEVDVNARIKLPNEEWTRFKMKLRESFKEAEEDLIIGGVDITAGLLQGVMDLEMASYQVRLQNLQNFYSNQQTLAGDNEKYKKELALRERRDIEKTQKELAERQKRSRMNMILIDTAASVAKTAAQLGFPAAIPFIAIALAQGAAQYAIASKTPTGFKDGVIDLKGPGNATSDSIPARLSRGESVMTAKETRTSKKTLQMIRAKQLDDTVLARIASKAKGGEGGGMFDDSRMLGKLNELVRNTAHSDFIKKGSMLYEVRKENDQYKKLIRQSYGL